MASVSQIGYIDIHTPNMADWQKIATLVGCEPVTLKDGSHGLRIDDDRLARIFLTETAPGSSDLVAGWELPGPIEFKQMLGQLEAHGASPILRPEFAKKRNVREVASFDDPDGFKCEIYWGAGTAIRSRFKSPQQARFVAGATGFGHVTMGVSDLSNSIAFYTECLGLKLTEIADVGPVDVAFFNANERHHSLAITQVPEHSVKVAHVMLEVATLDDLGSIRDRIFEENITLDRDLGRHPTDGVISMYINTPSPFTLEIGWGSVAVGPDWGIARYERTGWSWGHKKIDPTGAIILNSKLGGS